MPCRVSAGQRGQALLVVLVFLAAFLLITWAGLSLASAAFLGLNTVRTDARTTYALDAGLAYAMYAIDTKNGNVVSDKPVRIKMSNGTVRGNHFELTNSGEMIRFENGVVANMKFDPPPKPTAATP